MPAHKRNFDSLSQIFSHAVLQQKCCKQQKAGGSTAGLVEVAEARKV